METGAANAGEGAFIVHFVAVAGYADGADHLAMLVQDKLGAAFQEDRPVRKFFQVFHDFRLVAVFL